MRRASLCAPALALLLGGCLDFVDPAGLGLARPTRITVDLQLVDHPGLACGGLTPRPPADSARELASLCVTVGVVPGANKLGERLAVLDDTLRVFGRPVEPVLDASGGLTYRQGVLLPLAAIQDTTILIVFPRVESGEGAEELRWRAAGRASPDTLARAPGEGVRLSLLPPQRAPTPAPTLQYWNLNVAGAAATAALRGSGVPRAEYEFSASTLAQLGGDRFTAELRWIQQLSRQLPTLHLNVLFIQELRWAIVTDSASAAPLAR